MIYKRCYKVFIPILWGDKTLNRFKQRKKFFLIVITIFIIGSLIYSYPKIKFQYELNKAFHLTEKKDYEESVKVYNDLIKLRPDLYELHFNKAVNLYKLEKKSESLESFEKALTINDKDPEIYYNLSIIYKDIDKEKSNAYYEKAQSLGFSDGGEKK